MPKIDTWATKFFTDEIHIIGLGLSEAEIDIWWLITYRASLIYADRFNGRKLIKNKIVFHEVAEERNLEKEYMLKNNAITYQFHKVEGKNQYAAVYRKVAEEIFQ